VWRSSTKSSLACSKPKASMAESDGFSHAMGKLVRCLRWWLAEYCVLPKGIMSGEVERSWSWALLFPFWEGTTQKDPHHLPSTHFITNVHPVELQQRTRVARRGITAYLTFQYAGLLYRRRIQACSSLEAVPCLRRRFDHPHNGIGIFFDKVGSPSTTPTIFVNFFQTFHAASEIVVFFNLRPLEIPSVHPLLHK
jgi:hypothetical protein